MLAKFHRSEDIYRKCADSGRERPDCVGTLDEKSFHGRRKTVFARGEDCQGSSGWKRENGSGNAGESGILPLAGWIQLGGDQRDPGNTGIRGQPEKDIGDPPGDCTDQEHGTYRTFGELQGSAERGAERSTERSTERNTERSTETASGRSTAELPESRMVYLEPGERKKDSAMESRETTEVKKNIDRLRKETAIQREKLAEAEKKLQTERVEAEARILERERQIERELQLEKKRQAERELQSENQRQTVRKLGSGKEKQAEEQGPKIDRQQLEKRQQTEEKRLSESRKQLEREVLSESSEQPEGEPQSEKERQIESEIHLQEQKEELQTEFRKQIEKELQRERDSQREDLIRREGRFLQFSENTDESVETSVFPYLLRSC